MALQLLELPGAGIINIQALSDDNFESISLESVNF